MSEESDWVTGRVTLTIGGAPVRMEMTVPANPVKPQRVLPVLQQIAGSFANAGAEIAEANGESVSCAKGCSACCLQAVPLAEVEAYFVAELVEAMPEPRRSEVRRRFSEAAAHFARIGWFERLQRSTPEDGEAVLREYFFERVACPFLEDDACSIHEDRPMICREYLVTSPPENCGGLSADGIRTVVLPAVPSRVARRLGQSGPRGRIDFIPLVLALDWAAGKSDGFPEKTGEQWMADFFGELTRSAPPTPSKT